MNSLKPTGGWMGTPGEDESNTVELMECVVAAESTRGNVENITDYETLKKKGRIGFGPHRDLGKVAIPIFGGECPEPRNQGKEHSQCSGTERMSRLRTSKRCLMRWPSKPRMKRLSEELDALAWQVHRRIVEASLQASKATPTVLTSFERVSGGHSTQSSCSHFSNKLHTSWHFGVRGKGRNVRIASRTWAKRL